MNCRERLWALVWLQTLADGKLFVLEFLGNWVVSTSSLLGWTLALVVKTPGKMPVSLFGVPGLETQLPCLIAETPEGKGDHSSSKAPETHVWVLCWGTVTPCPVWPWLSPRWSGVWGANKLMRTFSAYLKEKNLHFHFISDTVINDPFVDLTTLSARRENPPSGLSLLLTPTESFFSIRISSSTILLQSALPPNLLLAIWLGLEDQPF